MTISCWASGGLGDTIPVLTKIKQLNKPVKLLWTERKPHLIKTIEEFWALQEIDAEVKYCDMGEQEYHKYIRDITTDYKFNTSAGGKSGSHYIPDDGGIINPFPEVKLGRQKELEEYEPYGVLQAHAGRNNSRVWVNTLEELVARRIFLEAKHNMAFYILGTDLKWASDKEHYRTFVGMTKFSDMLNIVSNADVVHALGGFMAYWAGINKVPNITMLEESPHNTRYYIHPEWKIKVIKDESEV